MKLSIKAGATSVTVPVFIQDSSSTTGAGKAGLAYNTSGLTAYYALPRAASAAVTLATLAAVTSSYSSGGFKELDSTNMPGWYRFDIPDAALASGRSVGIHLQGASGMAPCPIEIELTGWDNQDGTSGGISRIDAAISSRSSLDASGVRSAVGLASANLDTQLTAIDDYIDTEVAAIKAKTDNLPSDPADASDIAASFSTVNSTLATIAGYIDTEVAAIKAKTDNLPSDPADASDIAASFSTVNSTLSTIAGYIDTEVAAIKAKTDNLPASPAATGDIPTAAQVADKVLGRNLAGGSDGGRTVKGALRTLRNKVVVSGGTITVYEEDDTTVAFTGTVTTDAAADPITAVDPS